MKGFLIENTGTTEFLRNEIPGTNEPCYPAKRNSITELNSKITNLKL